MKMNSYVLLKETTKWSTQVANGVYILKDKPSKKSFTAVGFIGANTDEVKWLKNMSIDMRGRTFKVL